MTQKRILRLALTLVSALAGVTWAGAQAQVPPGRKPAPPAPMVKGADLYSNYCAACHGTDAKGTGPLANLLKSKPADLTLIAKRNGGQFPTPP